jgi:hypothetical protein
MLTKLQGEASGPVERTFNSSKHDIPCYFLQGLFSWPSWFRIRILNTERVRIWTGLNWVSDPDLGYGFGTKDPDLGYEFGIKDPLTP